VAGVGDIRRRIHSVTNMQQITKAMKMVAASKLRKSQNKVLASRPYSKQVQAVLSRVVQTEKNLRHPLLEQRDVKKVGYVLVTSDRGLCGGFNANLIRKAKSVINAQEKESALIAVGRKGIDFFLPRDVKILTQFTGLGDDPHYEHASQIADEVIHQFTSGAVDEVYLIYSKFVSVLTQKPSVQKLLPIEPYGEKANGSYLYEPSPEEMLSRLLPLYLKSQIYSALLENKASEMGAKMTAMDAATQNAKDMIAKLTLEMNRARQAAITTEISEIVGGASALE